VRTAVGADNVLLVDAGEEMQGTLLSNVQKGYPVIGTFNAMGFDVATFGNHEFDWGQTALGDRTAQATYPFVTANIVQKDTGDCSTAGWTLPSFADAACQIITVGTAPNTVKVAVYRCDNYRNAKYYHCHSYSRFMFQGSGRLDSALL
jgi:2',3'-cyclic-nucleotide 2'-phosphodiesterase (5'-nucleotidase family)